MRYFNRLVTMLVILTLLLLGCSNSSNLNVDKKVTLKVVCIGSDSFNTKYALGLNAKYPNITFETLEYVENFSISAEERKEQFIAFFKEKQPDIIFSFSEQYENLVSKGYLVDLDPLIKQDKFDIEGYHPGIIDALKRNGTLCGLTSECMSLCIYYNAELFQKHGVPLPTNQMSWTETFELAKRFSNLKNDNGRKILGFQTLMGDHLSYSFLSTMIGQTHSLRYINSNFTKVSFNTKEWQKAYELALDAFKSGIFERDKTEDEDFMFPYDVFIKGDVAMWFDLSSVAFRLEEAPFHWGVVTMPVDLKEPNKTHFSAFGLISAINAKSNHQDIAWKVLQYINSDDVAKIISKTKNDIYMNTRTKYIAEGHHDLSALTMLQPKVEIVGHIQQIPWDIQIKTFPEIIDSEAKKLLKQQTSIDQVLANIEVKAQDALDAYNEQITQKNKKEKSH